MYVPDPASVGQHLADAAAELVRRGHRVLVLTSDRGYDDPSVRYEGREVIDGVEVRRLPLCSFGKGLIAVRLLAALSFVTQAIVQGLLVRGLDAVVVSTSPPMASIVALVLSYLRGPSLKFWVMDLNPDQLVALGKLAPGSLPVRVFDALNRRVLARAADVIVLDRFMAQRVLRKLDVRDKLSVIPPWPLSDRLEPVSHAANPFRRAHALEDKRVVMYSGNHSPSNPLTTILRAAERLADDPRMVFLFVGGGTGKGEVEACASPNVRSLPYQPLDQLRYSLSAADVHLVTMGNDLVGIVHPCKIYGALAVARPIVFLGPEPCHVADILAEHQIGWRVAQGDVDGAERLLRGLASVDDAEIASRGEHGRRLVTGALSKSVLCGRLADVLERRDARAG